MALVGTLRTMSLPDLLQWLGTAGKSGVLHLERNKIRKRVLLRDGKIVACASDEPSELLGHFLVSRGKIDEETLRRALARHEATSRHLGAVLVELKAIGKQELMALLREKAEETIYSLFEWDRGIFRFAESEAPGKGLFPVELRVDDVLLRGLQRFDEIRRMRKVFDDPGIVLERTGTPPPPELMQNETARRIFDLVDGKRTVAEILLHAHGSEYLVTKFLFELHRAGLARIRSVQKVAQAVREGRSPEPPQAVPAVPPDPVEEETTAERFAPAAVADRAPSPDAGPPIAVADSEVTIVAEEEKDVVVRTVPPDRLVAEMQAARELMSRGEFEGALDLLNRVYREQPGDENLRRLIAEAEAAFVEKAYRHTVPGSKVPVPCRPLQELTGASLSPTEFYLLSRMDGSWDVESIIKIAPLREVEALRTLKRLRENGMIELRDPA